MARRKAPSEQARIPTFANDALKQLVDRLLTERNVDFPAPDLLGAVVLAACDLPLELVEALKARYIALERAEMERLEGVSEAPDEDV
jgi:hypothetical protein